MRYVAIRSEGGLIPYDLLDKIASEDAAGQKPGDFGLPKGRRLTDEISRVWADAQSLWSNFKRRRESLGDRDPYGTSITRSWIGSLLGDVDMLGFDLKLQSSAVFVNNSTYAISHRSGEGEDAIPVHIEGLKIDLDRRLHTKLRTSPQAMMQDFLNNNEPTVWGIVTNGTSLRILRNSSRTSRPTYLEFDLESILEGNRFNEFSLFYRVCHRSRFPFPNRELAECLLEKYYLDSIEQGLRVREKLREGVEETLKIVGTAFLQHPTNDALREKVSGGHVTAVQFHRQLLLLVYRLLFLMVAEERGLIVSVGENAEPNQAIYDEWYSITRLRDRAAQIIDTSPFGDVWQGLQQTFSLFEYGLDTNPLGIPPLNGDLFHQEHAIPDLKGTELYNHQLLRALRHLSLFKDGQVQQRVNYSALDVEELGSVYESLLDYQPVLQPSDKGLVFELSPGMERKKTGSYYTRPELVHELVESALVPVMQDRLHRVEKENEGKDLLAEQRAKEKALLGIYVCDPACGSGHFLLAAARRLGKELARIRTGEDEPKPSEFHLAVRDIISHCIYGVDLNPLAVDLCKVALWLEGHWEGKPLSFLDHRVRCGNSLTGILHPTVMQDGIPDDAFTAVTGDEKKVATFFKKRNKEERTSRQRGFTFEADDHTGEYAASNRELQRFTENTAADVRKKAEMYSSWRSGMQHSHDEAVSDLWTAQFFLPLASITDPAICTTKDFLEFAVDKKKKPQQVGTSQQLAQHARFFHWHLEFPEVFENGGFDTVLGNPPWEKIKLEEDEYWSGDPYIISAKTKAERIRRIEEYRTSSDADKRLRVIEFERARHEADCQSKFARNSTRFVLSAVGDVNTYVLFADLARQLLNAKGRCGVLVPTGVATDDTTKQFFADVNSRKGLVSLFDFENKELLFPAVAPIQKFCLFTTSNQPLPSAEFAFFLTRVDHLADTQRRFSLSPEDLKLMNPNTRTCPVFRTRVDADLTKKIYKRVPVLVNEGNHSNDWGAEFVAMFHMSNDSGVFSTNPGSGLSPLYEAKFIQQFDHRHGSYEGIPEKDKYRTRAGTTTPSETQKRDWDYEIEPRYWVPSDEVQKRLPGSHRKEWLIGFRDTVQSMSNRFLSVFSAIPLVGTGNKIPLIFLNLKPDARLAACFLAVTNSLVFDYVVRQKLGGATFNFFIVKQLPVLPPATFTAADIEYITSRVVALVYTSNAMEPFARDMGYSGRPSVWDDNNRADLKAELHAYIAHLYGFTRGELMYILDPQGTFGPGFPGMTFRILRDQELASCGEYRTQRLVLAAYDSLSKSQRFASEVATRESSIDLPQSAASLSVSI